MTVSWKGGYGSGMAVLDLANVPDEKRCTATSKASGQRCKKPKCTGTSVCETHGGLTPPSRDARNGVKLARRYGGRGTAVKPEHEGANPITGLAWEIRRTAGNIEYIADKLENLTDEDLTWGRTHLTVKRTLADELEDVLGNVDRRPKISRNEDSYSQVQEAALINVWAQMYLKERRHYVDLLKLAISSGLENRRIQIMEEHVLQVNNAIVNVISKLGIDADDPSIRAIVRNELLALLPAPEARRDDDLL